VEPILPENFTDFNWLGFSAEGLALMESFRLKAKANPAAPLTVPEIETIGKYFTKSELGEDFQIIRQFTRSGTSVIWADRNTEYLSEDNLPLYKKHGQINVFDGQPDVIKASVTFDGTTCYYVFDRATLELIPERTIIHREEN
jgi:hypothetical protein